MRAKDFIPASKPRNFVAKNQKTAGAGAHKDKKKAEKQGDVKHKGKMFDEGSDEHSQSRLWQMITAYEKQAKATSNDIKKQHYLKMADDLRGKLKTSDDVAEASPETTMAGLRGLKSWQVIIMNNYYRGKYSDYSGRQFYVLATSPEEAKEVVLDNADDILKDLLAMKGHNGKKILPRGSAVRITPDRIGNIEDGTVAGRLSTAGFKKMYSPQGVMSVKLSGGAIVDVEGRDKDMDEGRHGYDDFGMSLAPGHDEGEPVYNPYHDRTARYGRASNRSQDLDYRSGRPISGAGSREKKGFVFYNVNDPDLASQVGLKQTKSGKWYAFTTDRFLNKSAEREFGPGKVWYPKD